jgi:Flp pilus assembly protein TadG
MVIRELRDGWRRGAVTVEAALVMILTTSFIFGVFEYGRFVMDLSLLNNAAREGCRYALANNTSPTISSDVTTIVTNYMAGESASFTNFTVTVSGTHQGASTPVNNLAAGDMITVAVTGTYKFMNIVPIIRMPTSLSLTGSVTMVCEGGT